MHLRYISQHMATNVTNSFFQRLPTFIWLVFGHTISVQTLYTFYEVFVVSPSCFQSLILHLHSHVTKPDELCKEQKLLNIYMFYIIVNYTPFYQYQSMFEIHNQESSWSDFRISGYE